MRLPVLIALLLTLAGGAFALGVDQPLPDPAEEARAREIGRELRCLVCQNQSIDDSDAPLAADLRRIVREQVTAGKSDEDIKQYLVDRYGQWVLLRPPFEPSTWVLWIGPFVLLVVAGSVILWRRRRVPAEAPAPPLTAEEEARLAEILGKGDQP